MVEKDRFYYVTRKLLDSYMDRMIIKHNRQHEQIQKLNARIERLEGFYRRYTE